ncbi:hypothetical protein [Beijerinckia indica]|uniref:Transmembrane protein n=1 Tax=Beijerinckia indica subsp. indica (strain ATCC 9039 / DSM 1715 / NCIMB 8712) TaxID=395963 RepID=B2IHE3_BEII9|nr:hypothetical protein [Beijerinckia indica]ACB95928.1 hypothetical protein Bind_2315 [Beijerinckia indica subsp. indica ATCC 9039]
MSDPDAGLSPLRRLLLWLAQGLVLFYLLLDAVVAPLFRPIADWFARLALVLRLERLIADLSPYMILFLLAVPFGLAEPAKIYGLYLIGAGHVLSGIVTLVGAYLVSFVVVERIYHAGEVKLRYIRWFAFVMDWLIHYRDRLRAFVQSTRIWAYFQEIKREIRGWIADFRLSRD